MRSNAVVAASTRETRGKNSARRTRVEGKIPAVIYGAFKDPVSLSVNPIEILKVLRSQTGHNTIFDLEIEGGERTPVMVVDEQYDPVKSRLLHVDFKRIDPSKRIRVAVPVTTHGDPVGVKTQGGLLEIVTRQVEIESLPDSIPQQFTIDVSDLIIGQAKRVGDIPMPEGVRLLSAPDGVLAHVVGVKAEESAAPAAEAAPAGSEPEVVKKGKKEEEAADKGKKK